jgi:hypothetical protein
MRASREAVEAAKKAAEDARKALKLLQNVQKR